MVLIALASAVVSGAIAAGIWAAVAGHEFFPMPAAAAIVVGIVVGGAVGLINGMLITTLSLPPFIVTLGTLEGVRGLTIYMTSASPVANLPPRSFSGNSGVVLFSPSGWRMRFATYAS